MNITVKKITTDQELQQAFDIREEVFVKEQNVPKEEEYDEFEKESTHFLAQNSDGWSLGTARWRFTDEGIKIERFAVLHGARGRGAGMALVEAVLEDIAAAPNSRGKKIYLHAQLTAVPMYEKFGFKKVGDIFDECGIDHYKMEKVS
jgi:predicted GNAT family N-acyltransferase